MQFDRFAYPNYLAAKKFRRTIGAMGTVHKFTRPPKNENQFKGYRPLGPAPLKDVPGFSPKPQRGRTLRSWQKLRPWQRSLIAWTLLIVLAAVVLGVRMLIAAVS